MHSINTLGHAFLTHCRISKGLSEHTLRAYRQDLDEFEKYTTDLKFEEAMCRETIFGYLENLREKRHLKARTIKRRIACLKAFFKWLEREDNIETSPFHKMDITIRLPRQLPKSLSLSDMRRLEKKARPLPLVSGGGENKAVNPLDLKLSTHLAILLMAATGIRVGELIKIETVDIDEASGSIRIKGKGSRERVVFVTNDFLRVLLRRFLRGRRDGATFSRNLFLNRTGAPLTTQALRLRIKKVAVDADIGQNVTPHMLRHTAATSLVEAGVDIRYVQKLLGHQSISTTELYTHVSDQSLKRVLTKADTIGSLMP